MALVLHLGSGSPYAWRVWLALEHRRIPYELNWLSFDRGDLRDGEFEAINPRCRVPAIVDDGFTLYESAAIVEYLDEKAAEGPAVFPGDAHQRARIRRMVREADAYFAEPMERLVAELLYKPPAQRSESAIAHGADAIRRECGAWEAAAAAGEAAGGGLAGPLSAADFALYPQLALTLRIAMRHAGIDLGPSVGPALANWRRRMEALEIVQKTWPPHWR